MPSLERLYQQFKQKDFIVLAVNIAEPADQVQKYLLKHKLTFPALVDATSSVANLYGVRATPTRYLIGRDGKVVAGSIGPRDWAGEDAQRLIGTLLEAGKTPRKG